jgi:hypothetical protein
MSSKGSFAVVIQAMGAGRIAARSIDEYLRTGKW